jgi:thiamine pyrophosphokinase
MVESAMLSLSFISQIQRHAIPTSNLLLEMTTDWYPCGLLNGRPSSPYAVLILNQPINRNALNAVIESASLIICADGGANRLFDYDQEVQNGFRKRLPDAIVGDLDSLSPAVSEHYRTRGVQVVNNPDQYSTDFTKGLKWIRDWSLKQSGAEMDVVVLGGLGGRVDQALSQIHHLYMAENDTTLLKGRIYLLSEQSLSFVLASSNNLIHLEPGYFAENVGIIPVLGRTLITTTGLEWDVDQWPTEFGGQMSTSNHIRSDKIELSFQGPRPLFTMELHKHLTVAGP